MGFLFIIREFDDDTRQEGPELARVEPSQVGAALQRIRPGQDGSAMRLQRLLDDAPPQAFDLEDPRILKAKQLLLTAEELAVQFSAFDDVAKEEMRYAHYDRPEDPIRYSDDVDD